MREIGGVVAGLPSEWLASYVRTYEAGRVQRHPQARFVNDRGECCLVGALAGVATSAAVLSSPVYAGFGGSALERLSRHFESRRLSAAMFYDECVLVLAARRAAARSGDARRHAEHLG